MKGGRSSEAAPGPGASLWVFLALAAVVAGLHMLFRTAPRGVAVTADSIATWSSALNLLAGHGLVDYAGKPLTTWPPLMALLAAAAGRVGVDPPDAVRWINAAALAATLWVFGRWLATRVRRRAVVWSAVAIAAVSYPLSYWAAYMLSEMLMILFLSAVLAQLDAFLRDGRGWRAPALAGALAGLAAATRYPAAILIPFGSVALLLDRRAGAAARLGRAAVFGGIATAPLAVIVGRNWAVSRTLTGDRTGLIGSGVLDSLLHAGKSLAIWALPGGGAEWLGHWPWIAAGAACALVVCFMVACPWASPLRRAPAPLVDPSVRLFSAFAAAYLAFLFLAAPLATGQPIDGRFLLPAFLPALAAAALLADRFLRIEAQGREALAKRALTAALIVVCAVHAAFAIRQNAIVTAEWRERGSTTSGAYNSAYWDGSATLRNMDRARAGAVVYSNEAPLLWYHDRTAPPGKYRRLPNAAAVGVAGFSLGQEERARSLWAEELGTQLVPGTSIVWVEKLFDNMRYGVSDVLAAPGVRLVAEWEDGKLLRVEEPSAVPQP